MSETGKTICLGATVLFALWIGVQIGKAGRSDSPVESFSVTHPDPDKPGLTKTQELMVYRVQTPSGEYIDVDGADPRAGSDWTIRARGHVYRCAPVTGSNSP